MFRTMGGHRRYCWAALEALVELRGHLSNPELFEELSVDFIASRRLIESIAMLQSGAPALNRDEALALFEQLQAALPELRELRAQLEARGA